jgi:hypothetical protein
VVLYESYSELVGPNSRSSDYYVETTRVSTYSEGGDMMH